MDALIEEFKGLSAGEKHSFIVAARDIAAMADGGGLPAAVKAFDEHCATKLVPFLELLNKLGADCATIAPVMEGVWGEMRDIVDKACKCTEPDQAGLVALFAGVAAGMKQIGASIKRNPMENNMKTISEGTQALNWILVKPAPVDFMTSYIDGSEMWSNRIRKEFKGVNDDQIAFCVQFKALMVDLRDYVKEYHLLGLSWNPKGVPLSAAVPSAAPTSTSASTPAPSGGAEAADKADVFALLNAGEGVTSGLKRVTKDQQTWRAEYAGDKAAPAAVVVPKGKPDQKSTVATGTAKLALEGSKWVLDYQTAASGALSVDISDNKQTVYLYKCDGATVTVKGKAKSIIVDSCRKTTLLFSELVAGLEVVNSRSSTIKCSGVLPSVAIDKCDGVHISLPVSALDVEVTASKSSEMNLSWPDPDNADEMLERPIPEQYVHKIAGKSITARVSDLYSH